MKIRGCTAVLLRVLDVDEWRETLIVLIYVDLSALVTTGLKTSDHPQSHCLSFAVAIEGMSRFAFSTLYSPRVPLLIPDTSPSDHNPSPSLLFLLNTQALNPIRITERQ
jgi:hypothetical protein